MYTKNTGKSVFMSKSYTGKILLKKVELKPVDVHLHISFLFDVVRRLTTRICYDCGKIS
jgi:hypothetical protein